MTTEQAIQRLGSTLLYYNLHGEIKGRVEHHLATINDFEAAGKPLDTSHDHLINLLAESIAIIMKRGL